MHKQYMIVKMAAQPLGAALTLVPIEGTHTLAGAESTIRELRLAEPGSVFLIQEVGTT